ncbi:hypothetical protein L6164_001457 [Bauhinia variegata]|uniref:Uncharacterized protein n=1 Tax=Bauhinia variegata TaxID=167791 RepID=A0ACB9QBT6_BAUVA|nr:hypothetical protein L6164_001457 [Bauhinia variegata]
MSKNTQAPIPDSYPMTGGDGDYSYSRNSFYQRAGSEVAKSIVDNAIQENLDIKTISSSVSRNSFYIADFGCSVGPNTFTVVQNIIDAVQKKYQSDGLSSQVPEFEVFFNDHASNDFNTLFASLPPPRQYFAAGVPGSFHGRLFPESTLHIAYSSFSIQWLSKVPEELFDRNSMAWNKGRIYLTNAPNEVSEAYAAQFAKDMKNFLDARSKELVAGGLMVLTALSTPNEIYHFPVSPEFMFDLLGSSLMDMVKDGIISEEQVDEFNLPVFLASPEDMRRCIEKNGCFIIERMELLIPLSSINAQACAMNIRASVEGLISKHFGSEIIDELFGRFQKKLEESINLVEEIMTKRRNQLVTVLKRK